MKLVTLLSSLILAASITVSDNISEEPEELPFINVTETTGEEAYLANLLFHNPDVKPIAIEAIEVIELEEEISFCFDTKNYLPDNFNPLKGKDDLDWSKIELIEIEEEVSFNFNITDYLPKAFNPYACIKTHTVCNK